MRPFALEKKIPIPNCNPSFSFKVVFEFILHGIILNIIGIIGLIGNGICIAILSRPQMKSSTNLILCALASFDAVLIVTSMLMLR